MSNQAICCSLENKPPSRDNLPQDQEELSPCPFCGGRAIPDGGNFFGLFKNYGVHCNTCSAALTKDFDSPEDAAAAWNKRPLSGSIENEQKIALSGPFSTRLPLVLIEWVDSHYRAGWTSDDSESAPLVCRSVGWLVHDGDDAKVLSAHVSKEESPQRCGDMTIPSRAILQIREIFV